MNPILWTTLFFSLTLIVALLEMVVPSGGIFAVLAIAFLVTSIVFSFQANLFFGSLYTLSVCLFVPVFLWLALRIWPQTWIGRKILLAPENDPALIPNEDVQTLKQLIGLQGMAKSTMLLGGLIEIEGKRYNAVSDAEPVESGDVVRVIRIEGTSIIVRKSHGTALAQPSDTPEPMEDPFAEDEPHDAI